MNCFSPILIKNKKTNSMQYVPCGKCLGCQTNRRNEWSLRLRLEHKEHYKSSFVTLTYNDENIPFDKHPIFTKIAVPTLYKPDLQNYIKKIRKAYQKKIRYYCIGEYGEKTERPHYHILFFGIGMHEWDILDSKWEKGHTHVGDITDSSIHYCTKYVFKSQKYYDYPQTPFSTMSTKPAIGSKWLLRNNERKSELGKPFVYENGRKHRMPKYFREKIFTEAEREEQAEQARYKSQQKDDELYKKYGVKYLDIKQQRREQYERLIKKRKNNGNI
jgi:hypothetical protein